MAITCDNLTISLKELIQSLLVVTADGTVGIRTVRVSEAAADISPHAACSVPGLSIENVMRYAIGVSPDGEPALVLIEEE